MDKVKTKRLVITFADLNDLPGLEEIEKECDSYFSFDPKCDTNHSCSLRDCLTAGDMPPEIEKKDYKKENYHLCCIRQNGTVIGFFSYYLQYKYTDTAYLSVLYIKETHWGGGLGSEILEAFFDKLIECKFREVRLHCSLRNSTALRFWVKNGFDRIIDVECDGNLFPGNFGGVELAKSLF